jgi:hypothetical protein
VVDDDPKLIEAFITKPSIWSSPYIDVFLYRRDQNVLYEVYPDLVAVSKIKFDMTQYFPSRLYFYAGTTLEASQPRMAMARYGDLSRCKMSDWNHRLKHWVKSFEIDCCELRKNFPMTLRSAPLPGIVLEQVVYLGNVVAATEVNEKTGQATKMARLNSDGVIVEIDLTTVRRQQEVAAIENSTPPDWIRTQ